MSMKTRTRKEGNHIMCIMNLSQFPTGNNPEKFKEFLHDVNAKIQVKEKVEIQKFWLK